MPNIDVVSLKLRLCFTYVLELSKAEAQNSVLKIDFQRRIGSVFKTLFKCSSIADLKSGEI